MHTNRRNWIKRASLGAAAFTFGNLPAFSQFNEEAFTDSENTPVRLSSNENPYGPSPAARKAMIEHLPGSNRYDWDLGTRLISELARKHQVDAANILLGAGSTELLDITARYAAPGKGSFVMADPSYSYWSDTAVQLGLEKIKVPLTAGKSIDLTAMLAAIRPDTRLVYICNPNNPTGTVCNADELAGFIREATKRTLVLVDEAYLDFTNGPSLTRFVQENPNLVIAKTFSKIYGLAGARIGYALAHKQTLEKIASLQSWNNGSISVMSAAAALASLHDTTFLRDTYTKIAAARSYTIGQLQQLHLTVIQSSTNFIYFSLEGYQQDYFQKLKQHKITGTGLYEESGKWTRITVGTMKEMERFIRAIR